MHSPTTLLTNLIRQYLTVPTTMTDEFTDGYLRSIFQTLIDNFTDGMNPSVCHTITDGINPLVYFKQETFFFSAQFLSVKPSANIATDFGITDERKVDGCILSVRTSGNKLPMKA